jgi:ABC-2 type transport system permease protein
VSVIVTVIELVSHEWRTRLSRPAALVALALFAAALIYGAVNGRIHRDARIAAIEAHVEEIATKTATWRNDLEALEEDRTGSGVPPWAGSPMDVTFASYLPPAPLGDFAIGQSDLLPYIGAVSLWNPDVRLFSKYEIEDPVSLALGAFDLGKGIVFILPLVLIVLCFDVLSSERDANRLGLTLAQGARIRALLWARLAIRAGLVLGLTFLIASSALLVPTDAFDVSQRLPFFALWALCVSLYTAFWIAGIGFIASMNLRGEANVMLLLPAWAGLNLILPASVAAIAETVYPPPSRLAYLAEAREVEVETELAEPNLAHRFIADHPDMLVDESSEIPAYVRTAFFVTSTVDDATKPILAGFEQAAVQRDETLSLLRYVSPAIIVHGLFNDLAGTSSARHRRYVAQARAFKAAYAERAGPYIVAGQRLPLKEAAALPEFRFEGDDGAGAVLRRNAGVLLFLAFATGVLLLLADRRVRSILRPGD